VLSQGLETVDVGRIRAVYWPGDGAAATAFAEFADAATGWPGISVPGTRRINLIVVPDQQRFDSVTRGRLPEWGVGAAIPSLNTIVVFREWDGGRVLKHELAHLALREYVRFVPRWFDEGYASRAAGEWGRLDALQVNWALTVGRPPTLPGVNRGLQAGRAGATHAYAYATTAVLMLERMGGDRGLEPLLRNLSQNPDFDAGLRRTYGMTLGQFEERWRAELKRRYGWISFFSTFSIFWVVVLLGVGGVWFSRRERYRVRREALDEGWPVPDENASET
jgi:hypothetical protein